MPEHPERNTLRSLGEELFSLVLDNATPKQWAEWLRAPLEHAAGQGNLELVTKLLNAGANGKPGMRGCRGRTLLDAAAEGGNEKVVGALLGAGAGKDVNVRSGSKRRSPLHRAALMGHEAVTTLLLLAGADVGLLDAEKRRPLHLAVRGGHYQVVCNLLLAGSTPNAKDKRGDAPLHVAAALGHDKVASALLLRGADKNALDRLGRASLHVAAENGHPLVVHTLLAVDSDANIRYGNSELSVLDSAASHGQNGVLRVLLEHGVDVNATDSTGYTSLHMAADNNQVGTIHELLKAGANVEALDQHHWTPLHCAARYSPCREAISALLQHGANVQALETSGESPLHVACSYLAEGVVDLLLRSGADETAVNTDGCTPEQVVGLYADDAESRAGEAGRIRRLLRNAPADRAWRRRGTWVMARSLTGRIRLDEDKDRGAETRQYKIPKTEDRDELPSNRVTGRDMRLVGQNRLQSGPNPSSNRLLTQLVARVVELHEDGVFRKIVGYL